MFGRLPCETFTFGTVEGYVKPLQKSTSLVLSWREVIERSSQNDQADERTEKGVENIFLTNHSRVGAWRGDGLSRSSDLLSLSRLADQKDTSDQIDHMILQIFVIRKALFASSPPRYSSSFPLV